MRYLTIILLAISLNGLHAGSTVSKPEPQTPAAQPQTPPAQKAEPKMADQVDQHDQTDIFAIQLDSSEAEQDEEYNDLMEESEELQKSDK